MKRTVEALVMTKMVAVIAGMATIGLYGVARAGQTASPVVKLRADATLSERGADAAPAVVRFDTRFSTDTPGAPLFTVQRAVLSFPDRAGTNGRLFPSCSARQLERFRGNVRRCPKGSQIGSGTVTAQALQLGVTATGRVTVFNSLHGTGVTFNVRTLLPAYINRSFDARLTRRNGNEKLTLVVPPSLQQILDGVFVGVQDFDVTLSASVRRHGVQHSYFKARSCPTRGLRGVFDFVDGETGRTATTTVDADLHCRAG
jgi:hypothetical protein